ncbi:LIP-domain-containing protein [Aureobasidium sp. EXF-12298]|nr:LIP-domain-containing protein [Aureobasidium sp. EXF-12298]
MLSSVRDIVLALIVWVSVIPSTSAAILPQYDPFYNAPAGYQKKAPGTVLRTREVATSYIGLIPEAVQAWQLLYRTTALNGTAIAAATTIFKPLIFKPDRFVSFQTAYDGSAVTGACDPSFNYQLLAPQLDLISSVEFLLLQTYLLEGYIVQSPDYEGPDAAFGAGRLAGMGVLDSMRAVANFKDTLGLTTSTPKIVGYGYSGGAIATGWAASLVSSYAPELNVLGWAQGGTPANLTGTAVFIDGTTFAGFLPQAFVGLSANSAYGAQLHPLFKRIMTQRGRDVLDVAEQTCGVENLATFAFGKIQSTEIQTLGDRVFLDPTFAGVLAQNVMGVHPHESPKAPVYMYHAIPDEVIPYTNASTLFSDWCADGASVHFTTYPAGSHATTEILGFVGAFRFVEAAFAGTVASGCSTSTDLASSLDLLALGLQLEPVIVQLLNALAVAGRMDINIKNDIQTLNKTVGA